MDHWPSVSHSHWYFVVGEISNITSKQKTFENERRLLKYSIGRGKEIDTLPGKLSHMDTVLLVLRGRDVLTMSVAFATCLSFLISGAPLSLFWSLKCKCPGLSITGFLILHLVFVCFLCVCFFFLVTCQYQNSDRDELVMLRWQAYFSPIEYYTCICIL